MAELGEAGGGGWKEEEVGGRGGGAGTASNEDGGMFPTGGGAFAGFLHERDNILSSPSSLSLLIHSKDREKEEKGG